MNIPVILGTARAGRQSEKVAHWMVGQVEATGAETELIDVRDYPLTATDASEESEQAKKYIGKISAADAYVFVVPEYNHGYPGELKMMLDLGYKQYGGKPALICGVSNGNFGGARMIEQLEPVLVALGVYPIQWPLLISRVEEKFITSDELGDEALPDRAQKSLAALLKFATALKSAR